MKDKQEQWFDQLRKMAHQRVKNRSDHLKTPDSTDLTRLIDDIQVFQVELELQNEELRSSLEELEKSRTRFSRLFDMAPAGYVVLDESGMILQMNQTLTDMLKIRPDALMGKPFSRFISPEDQKIFLSRFQAFYRHPEDKTLEVRLVHDNRTICHARLQGGFIPFETEPGKPDVDRFCLIVTDITQSKKAENDLKKYARDLTERNKELKCLYSISRLISDSDLSMDDIMTQAIQFLTDAFQYPHHVCGRITLSGKKFTTPRFQKTDRHLFQEIRLKNEVIGLIDIYGSKEMPMTGNTLFLEEEKEMIDSVALRLGHALERFQAENRIRHLQKSESLGRMAGAMAHHYNNLLTSVMGNLEMAMQDLPKNSGVAENLEQAMQAADRISKLGATMLAYLGQTPTSRKRLDLSEICRHTASSAMEDIPSWILLETNYSVPGPVIQADAGEIHQILKILISNAKEAIGDRPGTIRLSIHQAFQEKIPAAQRYPVDFHPGRTEFACIRIQDTGPGIPDKNIEKIFDPFYSTKFTGRGLGLPIALGTVKSLGGCITVTAFPGSGTVFQIFLPVSV